MWQHLRGLLLVWVHYLLQKPSWLVIGGLFKFTIQCHFALKTIQYNKEASWTNILLGTKPVYLKAMCSTEEITSTLKVTVTKTKTSHVVDGFTFEPILKNVPSAQWAQCK